MSATSATLLVMAMSIPLCSFHVQRNAGQLCCHARFMLSSSPTRSAVKPLTEWLHFADLREGQPDYMVYLVRVLQTLGVLVNAVSVELAVADQPVKLQAASARKTQLTDGKEFPYMLRNSRSAICCHLV